MVYYRDSLQSVIAIHIEGRILPLDIDVTESILYIDLGLNLYCRVTKSEDCKILSRI